MERDWNADVHVRIPEALLLTKEEYGFSREVVLSWLTSCKKDGATRPFFLLFQMIL
jgi:hypothetical protein